LTLTVTSGQITIGDNIYTVHCGEGRAIRRRFGWIVLHGNTILLSGEAFQFRMEGMFHHERSRLTLAGLGGGVGDESSHTCLRLVPRLSKTW
jgi:hypothetical protein